MPGAADYRRMRLLFLLALPALFAAPALTASGVVPTGTAGSGSGTISGYTVSAVSYELDGALVDAVSFTLVPAGATTVNARLAPGEPWTACMVAGSAATCPVETPVDAVSSLDVVAAE